MKNLDVYRISDLTYDRLLRIDHSAKVHSIFERTLNILSDNGVLITLADMSFRIGPNCLIVKDFRCIRDLVDIGTVVKFHQGYIQLGHEIMLNYEVAEGIETIKIRYPDYIVKDNINNKLNEIQDLKVDYTSRDMNTFTQAIKMRLNQLRTEVKFSVECDLHDVFIDTCKKFIGLGSGLTPSGDDYLGGFALVVSLDNYPVLWVYDLLKALVSDFEEHTNIISISQFKLSLQGEAREEVMLLLQNLLDNNERIMNKQYIKEVLDIGSSSGSDLLLGIMDAVKLGGMKI